MLGGSGQREPVGRKMLRVAVGVIFSLCLLALAHGRPQSQVSTKLT